MESARLKILLSHAYGGPTLDRQLSPRDREIATIGFNANWEEADIWIVHDDLPDEITTLHARCSVLVLLEPEMQKHYPQGYLNQFDYIVTGNRIVSRSATISQQYLMLPWHTGFNHKSGVVDLEQNYLSFKAMEECRKTEQISLICSNDSRLPGHRARLQFAHALKHRLKDRLHWFGRGFSQIEDKKTALENYRFSVVMENSSIKSYWTEKLSDAILWRAFPIYWGAPDIGLYFNLNGMECIDIREIESEVDRIEALVEGGVSDAQRIALEENRIRILDHYTLPALARHFLTLETVRQRRLIRLRSREAIGYRLGEQVMRARRLCGRIF